jgi:hypothetical protein
MTRREDYDIGVGTAAKPKTNLQVGDLVYNADYHNGGLIWQIVSINGHKARAKVIYDLFECENFSNRTNKSFGRLESWYKLSIADLCTVRNNLDDFIKKQMIGRKVTNS